MDPPGKVHSLPSIKSQSNLSDISGDTASCCTDVSFLDDSNRDEVLPMRRVSFGPIHVREYERIIGDHPLTKVGVPLSLGWGYVERDSVSIGKYESDRIRKGKLRMSSITRKNILHNVYGFSEEELRDAEQEVQNIKKKNGWGGTDSKNGKKTPSKLKVMGKKIRNILTAENFIMGLSGASPANYMIG